MLRGILLLVLNGGYFYSRRATSSGIGPIDLCYGFNYNFYDTKIDYYAVRRVVTIKSNVIDLSINYNRDKIWHLK